MTNAATLARLRDLLDPVVTAGGCDLEGVEVLPAGRRSVVRVVVDRDGGIGLDDVAELSRAVSDQLDAASDVLGGGYVLEVTSPGVDRPLTTPRQWRRARGRLVATTVGGAPVTGRVTHVDEHGVVLDSGGQQRSASYDELGRGRVQVEFHHPDQHHETAAAGEGPAR